jgi:hypothetical protein
MNAIAPIEAALPRAPFEAARDAAAAWRGRCLDQFARSEAAVTETLLVLAAVGGRGASIKLPHLVGQRYDALLNATSAGGAFAAEGKAAAATLVQYRQHETLRTHIAHSTFTVTLDHRGCWHVVLRVLALRTSRASRDLLVTEEGEAAKILGTLERDGSRLRSTLGQLRKHFLAD